MSWGEYTSNTTGRNYHLGIDISSSDSNVYAAADGTVALVGFNKANGNYVIIKHEMKNKKVVYSFYAHLQSYSVKKGAAILRGAKLGVMGNTGSSSRGKHLHFAIVDKLSSTGGYYGYATKFAGDKVNYKKTTYYNPVYVIQNDKLP